MDADRCHVYLGTRDGLRIVDLVGDDLSVRAAAIHDNVVRDIAVHPDDPGDVLVGCGLRGWGLHRVAADGACVEPLGFEDVWVWGVTRDPTDPSRVYVGTEPPMVYVSDDGGATFAACDGIDDLASRGAWSFFHPPFHAGHVHGIVVHPAAPWRIVAGVEHGALIFSTDGGTTWEEALVGHDLHRIAIHPTDPDRILAATGAGLYESTNAALDWASVVELKGLYLHSIVFDPMNAERVLAYADRSGDPVHFSEDGGRTWRSIGEGLPAAGPADNVRFHPADGEAILYAGDVENDRSQLYRTDDDGVEWEAIGEPVAKVWRLEVMVDPPDT